MQENSRIANKNVVYDVELVIIFNEFIFTDFVITIVGGPFSYLTKNLSVYFVYNFDWAWLMCVIVE